MNRESKDQVIGIEVFRYTPTELTDSCISPSIRKLEYPKSLFRLDHDSRSRKETACMRDFRQLYDEPRGGASARLIPDH